MLLTSLAALALAACADDSPSDQRTSVPSGTGGDDGGSADSGLTEAGVDPNGGRDSEPASCFAACQNTGFTCQAKASTGTTVFATELLLDATGCSGSLKKTDEPAVALKLDCTQAQVCIGGAPGTTPTDCVAATFSAFTYGYTPNGGVLTVCTRN